MIEELLTVEIGLAMEDLWRLSIVHLKPGIGPNSIQDRCGIAVRKDPFGIFPNRLKVYVGQKFIAAFSPIKEDQLHLRIPDKLIKVSPPFYRGGQITIGGLVQVVSLHHLEAELFQRLDPRLVFAIWLGEQMPMVPPVESGLALMQIIRLSAKDTEAVCRAPVPIVLFLS